MPKKAHKAHMQVICLFDVKNFGVGLLSNQHRIKTVECLQKFGFCRGRELNNRAGMMQM